jgi:hypothetical protein
MALRDELTRLVEGYSLTELSHELSLVLHRKAKDAYENGDLIYGERLEIASKKLWELDELGL